MNEQMALPPQGTYLIPSQERVVFGRPAEEVVPREAERLGARRVFLTSTRSLTSAAQGPLQRVALALGDRYAGTAPPFSAHTPREDVVAAAAAARAAGADLLVAVGGGSVIDGTKAVLMCLRHGLESPNSMEPYRHREGGTSQAIERPSGGPRMLSVSTTLSAAEFTPNAGVTDSATREKQSFRHPDFVPQVAVLDPAATVPTPLPLLLSTGLRSVDHAVESHCAPRAHALTQMHARQGLSLLAPALRAIHADPADMAARGRAQLGMWQAIWASATGAGTGASHGIGYALGATFDVAHGHTSCVMLPAVLRWNEAVNAERQRDLLSLMPAGGTPRVTLAHAVSALVHDLNLPTSLQALGIDRSQLSEIARRALQYGPVRANPRPIRTEQDVMEILELAWAGLPTAG